MLFSPFEHASKSGGSIPKFKIQDTLRTVDNIPLCGSCKALTKPTRNPREPQPPMASISHGIKMDRDKCSQSWWICERNRRSIIRHPETKEHTGDCATVIYWNKCAVGWIDGCKLVWLSLPPHGMVIGQKFEWFLWDLSVIKDGLKFGWASCGQLHWE